MNMAVYNLTENACFQKKMFYFSMYSLCGFYIFELIKVIYILTFFVFFFFTITVSWEWDFLIYRPINLWDVESRIWPIEEYFSKTHSIHFVSKLSQAHHTHAYSEY